MVRWSSWRKVSPRLNVHGSPRTQGCATSVLSTFLSLGLFYKLPAVDEISIQIPQYGQNGECSDELDKALLIFACSIDWRPIPLALIPSSHRQVTADKERAERSYCELRIDLLELRRSRCAGGRRVAIACRDQLTGIGILTQCEPTWRPAILYVATILEGLEETEGLEASQEFYRFGCLGCRYFREDVSSTKDHLGTLSQHI